MISPNVNELPRRLEPISRDTFIDGRRDRPIGDPSGNLACVPPSNVTELRPAAGGGRRRLTLAAA
jgi:hypothetical protein